MDVRSIFRKNAILVDGTVMVAEVSEGVRRETAQSELMSTLVTKAIRLPCQAYGDSDVRFTTEAYVYCVQPNNAGSIRWVLRFTIAQCGKLERWGNVIGDSWDVWKNKVEYMLRETAGTASDHFAASTKARNAKALANSVARDADTIFSSATSHNVSTFALLVLISDFASREDAHMKKRVAPGNASVKLMSLGLLEAFITKFLSPGRITHDSMTSSGIIEVKITSDIRNGVTVDCAVIRESEAGHVFSRCAMIQGSSSVSLVEFIVTLVVEERRRSLSSDRRSASKVIVRDLFAFIHDVVECSKDSKMWDDVSLSQMQQLRSAMGLRNQSPACKCSVIDTCAAADNCRHPQNFVAAKDNLERGSVKGGKSHANEYSHVERYPIVGSDLQTTLGEIFVILLIYSELGSIN